MMRDGAELGVAGQDESVLELPEHLEQLQEGAACSLHHYCVPAALRSLQIYVSLPRTVEEAIAMFSQRFDHGIFLYLYRRFFPDEYSTSQGSEEIDPGWSYSPREVDFLYLVSERLFPLDIDFMSESGAQGDRATEMMYLLPYSMPWWYDSFESLSLGWQVLRLLSGTVTCDEIQRRVDTMKRLSPAEKEDLLRGSQTSAQAQPSLLKKTRQRFASLSSPFSDFGQVLALYQYQTGNPWLDTDENEILYEGTCWCVPHVEEITQTYQAAQAYEQRVNAFALWLEEDSTRISQLITMLTQELFPKKERRAKRKRGALDEQR